MTTTREAKADIQHAARTELAAQTLRLERGAPAAAPVEVAGDAVSFAKMQTMTPEERYWHLAALNQEAMRQQVLLVSKESGWDYERVERLFMDFIRLYEEGK